MTDVQENTEDQSDLSMIEMFNDDSESEAETEEETRVEAKEEEPEKGEAEKPTEEPEAKAEEEPVETPSTEQEAGQMAALIAERRKRQELENKLKEYETEKPKVPDPIEQPEEYAAYIEQKADTSILDTKITLSRDVMMDANKDYEEKESVFMGLVLDSEGKVIDQSLLTKFQESKNPAKFAYEQAKEHLEIQQLKDPKYREKLKDEVRLEVLKELEAESTQGKLKATDVPDLTTAAASGKNTVEVEIDDDSITGMFGEDEL